MNSKAEVLPESSAIEELMSAGLDWLVIQSGWHIQEMQKAIPKNFSPSWKRMQDNSGGRR